MLRASLFTLIAIGSLTACFPRGAARFQTRPDLRKFVKPETADRVSWKMVSKVLDKNCTSCHGSDGGVNLETYEAARRHRAEIDTAVFSKMSMPPRGKTMKTEELEILAAWLDMGAPHGARKPQPEPPIEPPPPAPKPEEPVPPTPVPVPVLEPTFASIMRVIVKPKCLECHNIDGEADTYPMDTLEDWLNPENKIVIPGDAAGSGFIKSVLPTARKIMPPKKSALKPLTPEEIEIISSWIRAGAKD